jgi:hypothetical protein
MTGPPVPTAVRGGTVYRIVWEPGSDRLAGTCHCGAERTCEDPVLLWQWLLSHPDHPGYPGPAGARE